MRPFEKFLKKTNEDEELFKSYKLMRKTLQILDVHEWQLEKGYRIPGVVYQQRAETLAEKDRVVDTLKKYGLLNTTDDLKELHNYIVKKFYEIDQEIPLLNDKPDYLEDEDN